VQLTVGNPAVESHETTFWRAIIILGKGQRVRVVKMRKIVLFIFIITCTTLLLLFVCAKNVNQDEGTYAHPIPPDVQLTDGINSIAGSVKIDNWHYRGKDNKFYLYKNESFVNSTVIDNIIDNAVDNDYINDSVINNSAVNDGNVNDSVTDNSAPNDKGYIISKNQDVSNNLDENNNQEVLFYNGNLTLKFDYTSDSYKYNQYHYPDKLDLQIFHKDNLIFQDDKIVLNNRFQNEQGNEQNNKLKNELKDEIQDNLLSELDYPIFQPKENGELLYKITASWNESESVNRGFYGQAIYEFAFFNDVPTEFKVSSYQTFPGELVTISAKYVNEDEKITLKSDLVESEIPFYKYEHGQIAVLPLSYNLHPSDYVIELQVERVERAKQIEQVEQSGSSDTEGKKDEITISVLPKDFPIQYLTVSDEVDKSTRNDEAYEEYNKYVGAVRKTNTPVKMWDGVFLKPVEGRITTEFGMRRFVNNAPTSYRHSGIDIAADKGTPVKATNSGKVILARHLILTGNTVIIDHGFGIISWSYHMDSINVKEGDDLVRGQIIGTVGSTGFSTGPHLHFAISVHDVFTNPWTLFEHEPAGL
jgi:murein DD-endopeptidase MepM/ murein hydrolase activator NlpD